MNRSSNSTIDNWYLNGSGLIGGILIAGIVIAAAATGFWWVLLILAMPLMVIAAIVGS